MGKKEVINIRDGARLGFICDLEVDCESGAIEALIVPAPAKFFGVFGGGKEYRVPWKCIKQIGDDIILIDDESEKVTVSTE
ncbi:MAG: YlmC/YmxH family sporulation protein [Clostridiales bacterium]|jgi:YlmC/YmxH family sporulation protein|nr:YlmC/YmxH family sporulation protein [Clostridiales bacterium]